MTASGQPLETSMRAELPRAASHGFMRSGQDMKSRLPYGLAAVAAVLIGPAAHASEADLVLPDLNVAFPGLGGASGRALLLGGIAVCALGMLFGLAQYMSLKKLPVHRAMLEISELIYATCKQYLITQGKFIIILEVLIGLVIAVYFGVLRHMELVKVVTILIFSLLGILGSYGVAWFGIRVNTFANSRTAFASLRGKPFLTYAIPLKAGFSIGESLGASALRIAGGIFTKIADIGSDLMKIVFRIKEDDARNPGVIADCTGDNAGDSVGPTADGFETYGVTGVALITFILLAVQQPTVQVELLVWIFSMRVMMVISSGVGYFINGAIAKAKYANAVKMNFEAPLTSLVWLTSLVSVALTYVLSYLLIPTLGGNPSLWWQLSTVVTCGTLAGAIIPEFVKVFT